MKKTISIVLVMVFIISLIPAVTNAKLVACVGDSITYGYGLSNRVRDCYPAQLARILQSSDSEWETKNFGANGATLLRNGDQPYIRKGVYNPALASAPEVVIIILGTNDSWPSNWAHKDDFIPDYLALIDAFAELPSNPEIFICCPPPIWGRPWGLDGTVLKGQIIPKIYEVAELRDVGVIDLHTPLEDSSSLLPDGCHPNTEGAGMIAEIIAQAILGFHLSPDFNDDKIVDIKDLLMLIEHWGQDESSVDIVADGVIDAQDLEVLMSYWQQEIFPPELIAYWKFDETEGGIAYDIARGNDGFLFGDPVWRSAEGKKDGALQLDGINDYVISVPVLNPSDGPFSVFTWIKGGAPGQVIISQTDGAGSGETWLGADALGGNLMTGLRQPGSRSPTPPMVSDFVITDGQWRHVGIVVRSNGFRILYVDGVAVAFDTQTNNLPFSNGGLYFGVSKTLDAGTFFSGLIDDIRIYNKALSEEEIEALAK